MLRPSAPSGIVVVGRLRTLAAPFPESSFAQPVGTSFFSLVTRT
jgi:hypothetical protein